MASEFHIEGPVAFQTDVVLADTFVTLGYFDNDELIGWTEQFLNIPLKSSRGGEEILEMIYAGTGATLDVLLTEWDATQRNALSVKPGGTSIGDAGVIGSLWVGGSFAFKTRIAPVDRAGVLATPTATAPRYTFPVCILDGEEGLKTHNIGVNKTHLSLSLTCLRDASTSPDDLYSVETS